VELYLTYACCISRPLHPLDFIICIRPTVWWVTRICKLCSSSQHDPGNANRHHRTSLQYAQGNACTPCSRRCRASVMPGKQRWSILSPLTCTHPSLPPPPPWKMKIGFKNVS
jgi:hypothetical protein